MSTTSTSTSSSSSDIINPKLGEHNYHSWVIKMKALLMSKKLWLHVKGIIPRPDDSDSGLQDWLQNAYAASGLMLLNMEDSQHTHVEDMEEDPAKMWTTLESVFILQKPNTRFMAYSTLLSINKGPDDSLPSVTTRVEQAIKDVKALCPKDYSLNKLYDDLCCMAMIRSLPSDFSSFVSAITLMDDMDMTKLKAAFINEESNRKAMQGQSGLAAAAQVTVTSLSNVICGWCERPFHTEENCFAKKASQQQDRANAKNKRSRGKKSQASNSSSNNSSNNSSSSSSANTVNSSTTESAVNNGVQTQEQLHT